MTMRFVGTSGGKERILVLVNGSTDSAAGIRARGLFGPLANDFDVHYRFREAASGRNVPAFLKAIFGVKPALVYVINSSFDGTSAGVLARLTKRTRFVLDTGDLAYELAELTGWPRWLGRKVIGGVENAGMRLADAVVVRGTFYRELLEQSGRHGDVYVIRDGIDSSKSHRVDVRELRRELGVDNCLSVGLMGSLKWSPRLGRCYGWDLVEAMALINPAAPIKAMIVGDGDGLPRLKRAAAELGVLDRIRFVGRVPYSEVPRYLSAMDVAVSTQTNNNVGRVRTTGKLPEYMAAGCFVLASDVGEAQILLPPQMRIPYKGVFDTQYPGRLAHRITELAYKDPLQLSRSTEETIARARRELDYSHLSAQVRDVVARVVQGRPTVEVGE